MKSPSLRSLALLLVWITAGCGALGPKDGEALPAATTPPVAPPAERPKVEESDIYRLDGAALYVQNAQTGLNILDVSNPQKPQLRGRATATAGSAGELYVREDQAIVILKQVSALCRKPTSCPADSWLAGMEVAIVDATNKAQPQLSERYCIPGEYVASRMVGSILYLVTTDGSTTSRALSLDLSDPRDARVVQVMELADAGKEILVTPSAIFVAGYKAAGSSSWEQHTSVHMISIRSDGKMLERGTVAVPGQPQGRFHMDLAGTSFRIVTFEESYQRSRLSVIDVSDPDALRVIGSLKGIGSGERLYATRFDGDRAYVVTFRQTDPLWVISLKDPTAPAIVGELQVPGWSDFLFPRGNRLIAVGRGDGGSYLGVSLFDVTNPAAPRALQQLTLGDPQATSEANVDHRAVTILEQPGQPPLIVVPHTRLAYGYSSGGPSAGSTAAKRSPACQVTDSLELVELVENSRLELRARVDQQGTIRRTLLVGTQLYSISDYEILALEIANRASPAVSGNVTVGSSLAYESTYTGYCESDYWGHYGNDIWEGDDTFICSLPAGRLELGWPPALLLLGLGWLALRARARTRR